MNIYTVYKLKYLQQGFTFSEVGHTINTLLDIGQVMLEHAVWLQLWQRVMSGGNVMHADCVVRISSNDSIISAVENSIYMLI